MVLKNKFHLTLVVLIIFGNSLFGLPSDAAHALPANSVKVDKNLTAVYNRNILLLNKYNLNNINIKYIGIKLYNINIINNNSKQKITKKKETLSNYLSFKEQVEIIMYSIKEIESHGRYKAKSKWSSACGAYQYMPLTWDNYKGFRNACLAPEWVQDDRMRKEIVSRWAKYHNWEQVIAGHYLPAYAGNRSKWNVHLYRNNPTIRQYVDKVLQERTALVAQLVTEA